MFSWYVSKQLPSKHGVEITLVLAVSASRHRNKTELRSFQPPVFAGYLFERQYRPVYEHRIPYVKGIPLQSI